MTKRPKSVDEVMEGFVTRAELAQVLGHYHLTHHTVRHVEHPSEPANEPDRTQHPEVSDAVGE